MTSMTLGGRRHHLGRVFRERFGSEPSVWARAPGRVDLMGSHTDYNLGYVLTLPIGRDTWIAARPRSDGQVRVHSVQLQPDGAFDLGRLEKAPAGEWSDYVRGVAWALRAEGLETRGFDGVVDSTVPLRSGLSSSAALECAAAVVFRALGGWDLDPVDMARLCQRAENEFVGVSCGILDQYTSCAGREGCALLLDCRDLSSRPVQIARGISVVICDTKAKRELAGSEYATRRAQCEEGARRLGARALREVSPERFAAGAGALPEVVARRCRFIIEESERVPALATALTGADREAIRRLAADSYRGARYLYEIGAPAMEAMMAAMLGGPGAIGARQAGAGFGGCMVAFVETQEVEAFARSVRTSYHRATGVEPETYPVEAAAGAGLVPGP